jgi:oligopeptide transport system substrate-binding protein
LAVRALRSIPHISYLIPLLALLLTACSPTEPRADLTILNGAEPESLDPGLVTGQPELRICGALFEGLTRYDPRTGEPIPGLAEHWKISDDLKTYTFHLRTNATWSSGAPITARDFVQSWRRVLDPASGAEYAGQLFFVKNAEAFNTGKLKDPAQVGVRAADDRTLVVELETPVPFFLSLCAFATLAVVPVEHIEQHGDRWLKSAPVPTSGAYTLEDWRVNARVRLRRNPRYWDDARTRNDLVDLLPVTSPNTALNLFFTGAADIIWDKTLVPVELLDALRQRPDFHTFDYIGSYFIRFNVTKPPFDNVRVRQALTMAVDKRRLVTRITRGGEKTATHHTPTGVAGYTAPEGLPHDPEHARRLLSEAGFPGGKGFPRFAYLFNSGAGGGARTDEKIAVELQAMWKQELGIDVELRSQEWKVYLATQRQLDYDTCRSSWIGDYNDANTFLDMFMANNGNNRTGWKSARYDDLVRRANEQADPRARERLLQQAEVLLIREDTVIAPLYFYTGFFAYDPKRIEGIHANVIDQHPIQAIGKQPGRQL